MEVKTPEYIQALLKPLAKQPSDRKVWGIGLNTTWVPFFVATNVQKDTHISADALGAPVRLAHEKDGRLRLNKDGQPVLKVAKDIRDAVAMVRQNSEAGLVAFTARVRKGNPEGYRAQVEAAQAAGAPVYDAIRAELAQLAEDHATAEAADQALRQTPAAAPEREPVAA